MASELSAQTVPVAPHRWVRVDLGLFAEGAHPSSEELGAWFDPKDPRWGAAAVTVGGRSAAWFLQIRGVRAVLRHYRRGGWAAKLLRSGYVWTGLSKTRAFE